MSEFFLHYIWQQKLFMIYEQYTECGLPIEVIDVGMANTDAGADFFNAKIRIGETMWVGNVEIHSRASDWERHGHQHDKAYNNVILHVVGKSDKIVYKQNGEAAMQCELRYPDYISKQYDALRAEQTYVPCASKLGEVSSIFVSMWMDYLLAERLEQKTHAIERILELNNNHWEESFYITLARNFGFHVNGHPFEMLARSLPQNCLAKHKDDLFQIEALLFGQAGLLEDVTDPYALNLRAEYRFLRQKYSLEPIDSSLWKMLRLRPGNFPHIRIAEFAALIYKSNRLLSRVLTKPTYDELVKLFVAPTSEYWDTHYTFDEPSPLTKKHIGKKSIDLILINTIVPFVFAYAKKHDDAELQEKALNLLSEIKPEKNVIIQRWIDLGIKVESAYDSQALLQLAKCYCAHKKCLQCRIGHKILQNKAK